MVEGKEHEMSKAAPIQEPPRVYESVHSPPLPTQPSNTTDLDCPPPYQSQPYIQDLPHNFPHQIDSKPIFTNQIQPQVQMNTILQLKSQMVTCPNCQQNVMTKVKKQVGVATVVTSACAFFWFWPCTLVPCFIDALKDSKHHCPNCKMEIGTRKVIC
ncbi:cell death-inducing p53 target 1 [Globomyces sp. JEL0801]|nr:cell death-inducing p53 target 1 [Globomyces sp. JEL0801]